MAFCGVTIDKMVLYHEGLCLGVVCHEEQSLTSFSPGVAILHAQTDLVVCEKGWLYCGLVFHDAVCLCHSETLCWDD